MITMYDSTTVGDLPPGAAAYAGYVDGHWPTYAQLAAAHPGARLVSITVTGRHDADCVDVETGDATPAHGARWVADQLRHEPPGARPIVYCSQSLLPAVMAALGAAGVTRRQVRLWTAHYDHGEHLCSPAACRAATAADGTQWADHGPAGEHYDVSTLVEDFFNQEEPMTQPPTSMIAVATGDTREYLVTPSPGVKLYIPAPAVANLHAFFGASRRPDGSPWPLDPAYMASLGDLTPKPAAKP